MERTHSNFTQMRTAQHYCSRLALLIACLGSSACIGGAEPQRSATLHSEFTHDPTVEFELPKGAWFTRNRGVPFVLINRREEPCEVRVSAILQPDGARTVTREFARVTLAPKQRAKVTLPDGALLGFPRTDVPGNLTFLVDVMKGEERQATYSSDTLFFSVSDRTVEVFDAQVRHARGITRVPSYVMDPAEAERLRRADGDF